MTYRTDYLATIELVDEQLGYPFVHQLVDALGQLLLLHRVGILDVLEHFRREARQSFEVKLFAFGQSVANLKGSVIRQTDDVTCPCFVYRSLTLSHELGRRGETHGLVVAHMIVRGVARELTRTYLTEGNTRTMVGVDVGGNLEDKAGELLFVGLHIAFLCLYRTRAGSYFNKGVQQFFYTKVVQGRTEEYRCQFATQIFLYIEFRIYSFDEFQFATELVGQIRTDLIVEFFGVDIYFYLFGHHLLGRLEKVEVLFVDVVYPFEARTAFDRPSQRAYTNYEFFFQFVEQIERVFGFTVHLVHEDDNRCITHTADFHQLACLGFHPFGTIHYNDNRIDGGQCAIGVFRKVLVTRCIEDVDFIVVVIELHHGGGYRDTTLFFDVHPVGCSCLLDLIAFYGTGYLYLSPEEQQLFGQRGLTGIRVCDNRKRSSSFNLLIHFLCF